MLRLLTRPGIEIVDVTKCSSNERYLYKCLAPRPSRKYRRRSEYLQVAIPNGFHKKIILLRGDIVGQIEYAAADASGYPISGEGIIVMNCIWVLRRAKGNNLGRLLLDDMIRSETRAAGFATIGLEGHWSGWLRKDHMEWLGFRSIDSIDVAHRVKHTRQRFRVHLMWLPRTPNARPPSWDKRKLLEGTTFCMAHPLYNPEGLHMKEILKGPLARP